MSTAPVTSPRPPERPSGDVLWNYLTDLDWSVSEAVQNPLHSPNTLVLAGLLLLVPLFMRITSRAKPGAPTFRGRWRIYRLRPDPNRAPPCNWRVGSMRMASGMQKWHCETCGMDGFSSSATPPDGCKWMG